MSQLPELPITVVTLVLLLTEQLAVLGRGVVLEGLHRSKCTGAVVALKLGTCHVTVEKAGNFRLPQIQAMRPETYRTSCTT